MENNRTLLGNWFLPNAPEIIYSGTFYYNRQEGCSIEIVGAFEGFMASSKSHNLIQGIVKDGKRITLVNCQRVNCSSNMDTGLTISKYVATFAIIGEHFAHSDNIEFDGLYASIADLGTWIGIYGMNTLQHVFEERPTIKLEYQRPENKIFQITDNLQLEFDFNFTAPGIGQVDTYDIVQKTFIGVKSKHLIPLKALLNNFFNLYKFLCFAYFDSPPILEIRLQNSNREANSPTVELLYSDYYYNKSYKAGERINKFLFKYHDVTHIFCSIVSKWFSIMESNSPAINLLTELLLRREYPLEIKFLSAIQAVETFHRNMFGGSAIPETEHDNRVHNILDAVPEEHRSWLQEKLAYSNEPSLRQRLKELYKRMPKEISSRLISDQKSFISRVIDTRNYYTHYNPKLKNQVLQTNKLFLVVEKLKIMLVCLILNELGISQDQQIEFVRLSKTFPYIEVDTL